MAATRCVTRWRNSPRRQAGEGQGDLQTAAKNVLAQYLAATALANNFVAKPDASSGTSTAARIKFVQNAFKQIASTDDKIVPDHQGHCPAA